jgi:hypothetical protein
MSDRKIAVFGVYSSREAAGETLNQFDSAGFQRDDISVLLSGEQGARKIEKIELPDRRTLMKR